MFQFMDSENIFEAVKSKIIVTTGINKETENNREEIELIKGTQQRLQTIKLRLIIFT